MPLKRRRLKVLGISPTTNPPPSKARDSQHKTPNPHTLSPQKTYPDLKHPKWLRTFHPQRTSISQNRRSKTQPSATKKRPFARLRRRSPRPKPPSRHLYPPTLDRNSTRLNSSH